MAAYLEVRRALRNPGIEAHSRHSHLYQIAMWRFCRAVLREGLIDNDLRTAAIT
jgi:hypothetical protein